MSDFVIFVIHLRTKRVDLSILLRHNPIKHVDADKMLYGIIKKHENEKLQYYKKHKNYGIIKKLYKKLRFYRKLYKKLRYYKQKHHITKIWEYKTKLVKL